MSLGATHIRFALDVKEEYKIKDLEKYISGVIYPDSRYITGIDRNLTHAHDLFVADSDFKRGWQVHLICDEVQEAKRKELLPDLYKDKNIDPWITNTAIKIIQDIDDFEAFNIQDYLDFFVY
jgi:hypothetical protein